MLSNQELSSETTLFEELNDTQQETVSGGLDLGLSVTGFSSLQTMLATGSTSGPGGSTAMGTAASLKIDTFGLNGVLLGA